MRKLSALKLSWKQLVWTNLVLFGSYGISLALLSRTVLPQPEGASRAAVIAWGALILSWMVEAYLDVRKAR